MKKMVLDTTFVVYPGDQFQMDYMLSRFHVQGWTGNLHCVTTDYYTQNGQRYFKNIVRKYIPCEVEDGEDFGRSA